MSDTSDRKRKHICNPGGEWPMCCTCDGRIHFADCTSRMDKHRDCCKARHEMLHSQGQTTGIFDSSLPMLPYK